MKKELGNQIKEIRKQCGVSTYDLEKRGIHPSLPSTIERGEKGYTIDTLEKYLNAIDESLELRVVKSFYCQKPTDYQANLKCKTQCYLCAMFEGKW